MTPSQKYLTSDRAKSIMQYIEECKNGRDTVEAWNAHKERMQKLKN